MIHKPEVAERVMDGLIRGDGLEEIWKEVEKKVIYLPDFQGSR